MTRETYDCYYGRTSAVLYDETDKKSKCYLEVKNYKGELIHSKTYDSYHASKTVVGRIAGGEQVLVKTEHING